MVMLSEFLRFRLTDGADVAAVRLVDVVVDLAAGDYPPVTMLVLHDKTTLAWDQVQSIDWRRCRISVKGMSAAQPARPATLARNVLARRDIMDALVVDVGQRHTLRANDLWLREQDGYVWLAGADASPWAVLRRVGRGLFGRGRAHRLVDWKDLEFLRGDPITARAGHDYHRQITRLQPSEIARLLDALPYLHAAELLTLIPDQIAADTLEDMSLERQAQVIQVLEEDQAVRLVELMAPDLAADLLGVVTEERAQRLLSRMADGPREQLVELLRYPAHTAGGIMTNRLVCVPATLRVGNARRDLKPNIGTPDFAHYLYVVDDPEQRRLQGVISMREFAVADEHALLGDLMNPHVTSVEALEPADEAARRVAEHHLAALPVTSRDGRLLGAITIDAALAHIAPAAWRDQVPRIFS